MTQLVKQWLKCTPLYPFHYNWKEKRRQLKEFTKWEKEGKPLPPPHLVKQQTLRSYSVRYGLGILVETGTYLGEMVEVMRKVFNHVYSIELNMQLYDQAKARFSRAKNIDIIHGDSSIELGKLMITIDQPALFWLDGHYSGGLTSKGEKETPILEELHHILSATDRGHVVLIDDARFFGTDPSYPTIEMLKDFVKTMRPNLDIVVQDDCIRIVPMRGVPNHFKKE